MNSVYPSAQQVVDSLGDKVVEALSLAVVGARDDLSRYRRAFPDFVAGHSDRGLLNWVHDRMWVHLRSQLDDVAGVSFVDRGPLRELWVGTNFRCRLKKHDAAGMVRTYPTAAALDFMTQRLQPALDGLEDIPLCAGYIWDPAERDVGPAVLSLRDGLDNVIWLHQLAEPSAAGGDATVNPIVPPTTPERPAVGLSGTEREDSAPES